MKRRDWNCAWLKTRWACFMAPVQRERERVRAEMAGIPGLIRLLMTHRGGVHWKTEERRRLVQEVRKVVALAPYLVALVVPGSFILVPVVAWWRDRPGNHDARIRSNLDPSRCR